jgi:UDP-N-acetyl-D-glucosamine dehydrogenase
VPSISINGHALKSVGLTAELVQAMDCVAILTDHSVFDYALIANFASLIFDTRNALTEFPKAKVTRL